MLPVRVRITKIHGIIIKLLTYSFADESYIHFRIELKGNETLRVRQVKLLGIPISGDEMMLKTNVKLLNASQIQHRNCESETLRVFRLLTSQVFGKLILGSENDQDIDQDTNNEGAISNNLRSAGTIGAIDSNGTSLLADSLDLREHMVGILFSRSKLSHLQKQVIVHIVHAIRKETIRAKDEWEANSALMFDNGGINSEVQLANSEHKSDSASENSRAPDIYCFEMLSMVLALSGSAVGRSYLSNQHGLLKDLLTLLHTGSDRVQRQVTALLRRILSEITPEQFADLLNVYSLPPSDFNISNQNNEEFDMNRLGVLDIFLAVIAKSLQLQVKVKSASSSSAVSNKQSISLQLCNCIDFGISNLHIHEKDGKDHAGTSDFEFIPRRSESRNLNQRWFLRGTINIKQAENIITLIRDMASVCIFSVF